VMALKKSARSSWLKPLRASPWNRRSLVKWP